MCVSYDCEEAVVVPSTSDLESLKLVESVQFDTPYFRYENAKVQGLTLGRDF